MKHTFKQILNKNQPLLDTTTDEQGFRIKIRSLVQKLQPLEKCQVSNCSHLIASHCIYIAIQVHQTSGKPEEFAQSSQPAKCAKFAGKSAKNSKLRSHRVRISKIFIRIQVRIDSNQKYRAYGEHCVGMSSLY